MSSIVNTYRGEIISKNTTMRKLEKIIDPKVSDLCGMPKGADGLELRLSNSYFVALD